MLTSICPGNLGRLSGTDYLWGIVLLPAMNGKSKPKRPCRDELLGKENSLLVKWITCSASFREKYKSLGLIFEGISSNTEGGKLFKEFHQTFSFLSSGRDN